MQTSKLLNHKALIVYSKYVKFFFDKVNFKEKFSWRNNFNNHNIHSVTINLDQH